MRLKETNEAFAEWLADRPQVIKDMVAAYHPYAVYKLKTTGQTCVLSSYYEDGTVSIKIFNTQLCVFMHGVFGINPADLEECDVNPVIAQYILDQS